MTCAKPCVVWDAVHPHGVKSPKSSPVSLAFFPGAKGRLGCCLCKAGVSGRSENIGNGLEPRLCSPVSGCCSRRPGCVSVLLVTCMEVPGGVRDRPLHCSGHGASWEKHLRSVPQLGQDCAVGPGQP